jgi:G3E family GTPase
MAEITLIPFLHPTMKLPINMDSIKMAFRIRPTQPIGSLMDDVEDFFDQLFERHNLELDFSYNVIWNIKDFKKALPPDCRVGDYFVDGDSFGVYGDVMPREPPPLPEKDKTPVVILTGFLGSGKTTLLNYMLSEQREKKIAVIENEFGEVSIDDSLLHKEKMALAEKIVVMDNGCMCCTLRGDLVNGLQSIIDEMAKGAQIDLIAIETTGMADPVPIVRTFMSTPSLTETLRLDGVVALADAKHLPGRLDDEIEEGKVNEAFQQIAFADKVILNKLDLISAEEAIAVRDRIRSVNKFAKILPAVKSRIKLDELTNMRAHDMGHFVDLDISAEEPVASELTEGHGHGGGRGHDVHGGDHAGHGGGHGHGEGHGGGHGGMQEGHGGAHADGHGAGHVAGHSSGHGGGHGHGSTDSRHDKRVNSFSIVREGEIFPLRLSMFMQQLACLPPEKGTVFRIKGIFALKGFPLKKVFHAVMDVSDEDDAGPWKEGERKISKIVFIGKGLDQKFFRDLFEAMFVDAFPHKKSKHDGPGLANLVSTHGTPDKQLL